MATQEETLRATIGTMLIATSTTGLRGMTWINLDHDDPLFLSFVSEEIVELGKRPAMQPPFGVNSFVLLASSHLSIVSNVLEVFQDERGAWESVLHDTLGEDMIAIPVEASLLTRQTLEMSLRRFRSVGLQLSLEAEVTTVNLFPVATAEEVPFTSDCWTVQPQVNPNDFIGRCYLWLRNLYHDMQPPCAFAITEVCSTNRTASVFSTIGRYHKGNALFASTGRETNQGSLPIERVRVDIVADRTGLALRAFYWLEFWCSLPALQGFCDLLGIARLMPGLPGKCALKGLSSLDPRLDEQIRYQSGTRFFGRAVRCVMQPHTILLMLLPTIGTHLIERFGKLSKRLLQGYRLLWCGVQLDAYRSIHAKSVPYMSTFL